RSILFMSRPPLLGEEGNGLPQQSLIWQHSQPIRRVRLVISFAFFSVCAWSQTQLGTIFGTITDPSAAVVPGTQVTITNQSTGLTRDTITDPAGQYRLAGLPTGTYVVRIEKTGFQTQIREGIALFSGSEVLINLSLSVGEQ